MALKDKARKHVTHDGAITWYLMPYRTLRNTAVIEAMSKAIPADNWTHWHRTFLVMEGFTVEIEFAKTDDAEVNNFRDYWFAKPANVSERFDEFVTSLTSASVPDGFWEAYRATRDEQIEAVIDPNSQAAS